VNGRGSLKIKVKSTSENSYLIKSGGNGTESQQGKIKNPTPWRQSGFLAHHHCHYCRFYHPGCVVVCGREFNFALTRMVTVMVIACPHALGLAIPLVVAISTSVSAKNGLLIRNRTSFENSRRINAVVFDKTGTLTLGNMAYHVMMH
jgi:P-type Cu2+ transporter